MKHISIIILLLLSSVLTFSKSPSTSTSEIEWISFEELETKMKEEPRKVMIDVYTNWCGPCKRMELTTFRNEVVSKYVNNHYYAVKFNAEEKNTIKFKNKEYKYLASAGRNGLNELTPSLIFNRSYPTVVFMDEKLDIIQKFNYLTPEYIERIVKFFGENAHKNDSWENFNKTHKFEL
ncbi:MAG: thioredoxin family protein [Cyclobacteriaceae bacterium]